MGNTVPPVSAQYLIGGLELIVDLHPVSRAELHPGSFETHPLYVGFAAGGNQQRFALDHLSSRVCRQ